MHPYGLLLMLFVDVVDVSIQTTRITSSHSDKSFVCNPDRLCFHVHVCVSCICANLPWHAQVSCFLVNAYLCALAKFDLSFWQIPFFFLSIQSTSIKIDRSDSSWSYKKFENEKKHTF
jgi:hypothetical protein